MVLAKQAAFCILMPFFGTALGAAAVFFLTHRSRWKVPVLGFSAGVMLAAMVWSLLMPAMEYTALSGGIVWLPATVGFLAGVGGLLGLDAVLARKKQRKDSTFLLTLAVTLHNLPEGMAVGVALAQPLQAAADPGSMAAAFTLSLGIAIQNLPEGAIISAPLAASGWKKSRAFLGGVLSGAVEPLGAVATLLLTRLITGLLPYVLAFAAGTMLYVTAVELIPETQADEKASLGTVGLALGFAVMMLLDVALG